MTASQIARLKESHERLLRELQESEADYERARNDTIKVTMLYQQAVRKLKEHGIEFNPDA